MTVRLYILDIQVVSLFLQKTDVGGEGLTEEETDTKRPGATGAHVVAVVVVANEGAEIAERKTNGVHQSKQPRRERH